MTYPNRVKAQAAVVPESGLLIGTQAVADVFGVSTDTILRWRKKHDFPGAMLPSGVYAVTLFAINDWIESRRMPPNKRAREALKKLPLRERAKLLLDLTEPQD